MMSKFMSFLFGWLLVFLLLFIIVLKIPFSIIVLIAEKIDDFGCLIADKLEDMNVL